MNKKSSNGGFLFQVKDFFRKKIVSLKRNPVIIPMLVLVAAFLLYSLNLTNVSNTTAKINRTGMGLCQFVIMLLSMLSMLCLLNAFPRRKKPNYFMVGLIMVMFGIMIYCSIYYGNQVMYAVYYSPTPIVLDANNAYIPMAYNMLQTFMVLIGVTAALVLTLPLYSKLLKKINTSIEVEDNGEMADIEITD